MDENKMRESDKLARKAWLKYIEQREEPTKSGPEEMLDLWADVAAHLKRRFREG